jgi:hypothetical protein
VWLNWQTRRVASPVGSNPRVGSNPITGITTGPSYVRVPGAFFWRPHLIFFCSERILIGIHLFRSSMPEDMMLDFTTFTQRVTLAKDLVTIAAAFFAAYVAWQGLSTWHRQLRGGADFDIARRVLSAAYRIREGIMGARAPFIPVDEMISGMKEAGLTDEQIAAARDTNKMSLFAYQSRLNRISKVMTELDVAAIEAEVIWGNEIRDASSELRRCVNELFITVKLYAEQSQRSGFHPDPAEAAKLMQGYMKIVFPGHPKDEFGDKVQAAISKIEVQVKPHLKR